MSDEIEYFFTCPSPFAFFGHDRLMKIAEHHGKRVIFRPFNMAGVWEVSGSVPPAKRSPTRQRYRSVEMQRIAHSLGLDIHVHPKAFPPNPVLGDHCIIALQETGGDVALLAYELGKALWVDDRDIGDAAVIASLLNTIGADAEAVMRLAQDETVANIRAQNTQAAIEADAVGAPAYVYRNEVFWGQDRLDLLAEMIASNRAAFQPVFP